LCGNLNSFFLFGQGHPKDVCSVGQLNSILFCETGSELCPVCDKSWKPIPMLNICLIRYTWTKLHQFTDVWHIGTDVCYGQDGEQCFALYACGNNSLFPLRSCLSGQGASWSLDWRRWIHSLAPSFSRFHLLVTGEKLKTILMCVVPLMVPILRPTEHVRSFVRFSVWKCIDCSNILCGYGQFVSVPFTAGHCTVCKHGGNGNENLMTTAF
jgi:hypothetical protein